VRTTKLFLDLGRRNEGVANTDKRSYLDATANVLTRARSFYLDFFLAHSEKLAECVAYYSEKHLEQRERRISSNELLTWAQSCTVATKEHPHPWEGWNFTERFLGMPCVYRRTAIKDAIGKERTRFVRLKVYTGATWQWHNYPIKNNRYLQQRLHDLVWEKQSPKLVLRATSAELHFSQIREISAKKIAQSKQDPDLVTVAVDLNVKFLATPGQNQSTRSRESVCARDRYRRGEPAWNLAVLLPLRRPGREVLVPGRETHRGQMGQVVRVPDLSLRGASRSQCVPESAPFIPWCVSLASPPQTQWVSHVHALFGYKSGEKCLWRAIPMKQARPVCR
jgi:hypothetical protein